MKWRHELIEAAWEHARATREADGELWRLDACNAWIRRDHFGRHDSEFGWKIENISAGGPDTPENLRPYHLSNRYDIANRRQLCSVIADRTGVPAGEYVSPPRNRSV